MTARKPRLTADAQPRANGIEHLTPDGKNPPVATPQHNTPPEKLNGSPRLAREPIATPHHLAHEAQEKKVSLSWMLIFKIVTIAFGIGATVISTLIASGWINAPAKQVDVSRIAEKVDTLKTSVDFIAKAQLDARDQTNDFKTQFLVWSAHIEEKLERVGAAPPSPIAPVAAVVHRKPAKAQKRVFPF